MSPNYCLLVLVLRKHEDAQVQDDESNELNENILTSTILLGVGYKP